MYYSQKNQDRWVIEEVLTHKQKGFFLDLAATDGIHLNNTLTLEKHYSWQGICIEPNPKFYEKLIQNRDCITENSVVSNECESVKFRADNGVLGGIIADDTDNSEKNGVIINKGNKKESHFSEAVILELNTVLLQDILNKHNAPREIDYWSLDIEGSEERVISSFDFSQYTFGCITIERPTPLCNEILQKEGYVFVKNFQFDSFYVHSKYSHNLQLEPFSQIPSKDSH
jgi:FkbM family methyltransferase